jgi:hypothetical protein
MRATITWLGFLCLTVVMTLSASASASPVYPPDAEPLGMRHRAWEGSYQVWMSEIPRAKNPLLHPDSPRNCKLVDGVVFLGAAGANCAVPTGTPLAFSVAIGYWECSTAEGLGESYFLLRRCATKMFARDINARVYRQRILIDGNRLARNRRWIFRTPGEIIDFPMHNIWNTEPGPSKSVTKGFFFILKPLDVGLHTVRVKARDDVIGKFLFVWKLHAA